MITAAADLLLDPVRRSAFRDGATSVRVEYRTAEPAADAAPMHRPRRPNARGKGPRPTVRMVWQDTGPPPPPPPTTPPPRVDHVVHEEPAARAETPQPPADVDEAPLPPWSALAVAAAFATLTCTPVCLLLGLLALRQIRRTGRRGLSLARFATVVGGLFLVLYLLLLPSTLGIASSSHV
jgi:hypothetical protein